MNTNYALVMENEIKGIENSGARPSLLLHSCCAPCSSSVLELLIKHFDVTVFYYNPNIYPEEEFYKRRNEQEKFCLEYFSEVKIPVVKCEYNSHEFYSAVSGLESEKEGGPRCTVCYRLRLEKTAQYAASNAFDYYTTTLSVSPMKDSKRLNSIGGKLGESYRVKYLFSDFKKQDGYKRSCEISRNVGMYRQDYCGCVYSMKERHSSVNYKEDQNLL